jgi:hypothetical protein
MLQQPQQHNNNNRRVDKNVTITWTASTDTGSALKEYTVYRGTSDFTTTRSININLYNYCFNLFGR